MTEETKLQIAKEVVKIWEENPELNWDGLIEEIKLIADEVKNGVTYEME